MLDLKFIRYTQWRLCRVISAHVPHRVPRPSAPIWQITCPGRRGFGAKSVKGTVAKGLIVKGMTTMVAKDFNIKALKFMYCLEKFAIFNILFRNFQDKMLSKKGCYPALA